MGLSDWFGGGLRADRKQLRDAIDAVTSLLDAGAGPQAMTTIPDDIAKRSRTILKRLDALLNLEQTRDRAALQRATKEAHTLLHKVATVAFDNATGPTFEANSLEDALGQFMESGKGGNLPGNDH